MKLGDMELRVRRQLPQSGGTADMAQSTIWSEINNGVDKVNLIVQAYKTYVNVSNDPNVQIYSLSDICPGFLSMAKSGVIWFNTDGQSISPVPFPVTLRWLDNHIPNWRNQPVISGNPNWYWHEGDDLGFDVRTTQASTNANKDFRVHYLLKATPMTNSDNYPWTNLTTELTALKACDDAICAYAVWKLAPAVLDQNGNNYYEGQFKRECQLASLQVKRQWDMTSSPFYYMRPDVSQGFLPR